MQHLSDRALCHALAHRQKANPSCEREKSASQHKLPLRTDSENSIAIEQFLLYEQVTTKAE